MKFIFLEVNSKDHYYACSHRHCKRTNRHYNKFVDWGYYSTTNGECKFCMDKCSSDPKCGGVVCGELDYCSWWALGKCTTYKEKADKGYKNLKLKTCIKTYR